MSIPQSSLLRSNLTLALVYVFAHSTLAIRADEPELRVGDDWVIPLVRIEPGEFEMGRRSRGSFAAAALSFGEQGDWATEGPVRQVTICKPFLIGKYKITTEQFCRFLNSTDDPDQYVDLNTFSSIEKRDGKYVPQGGKDNYPMNVVHWDGATQFCKWLSTNSGRKVRLPTEADWEYVARGTDGRKVPWGSKEISSWTSSKGAAVDAFPENSTPEGVVGMVDVRVGEWCSDFYGVRYLPDDTKDPQGPSKEQLPVKSDLRWLATVSGEYHVQRGRVKSPYWSTTSRNLGSRVRDAGIYGFRIVVELEEKDDQP